MAARLTSTFVSQNGTEYRVELHDQLYTGAAVEAQTNTDGCVISVGEADSERYQPIMGSSCSFTYLVDSNPLENILTDIANSEEKRFQLVVYRAGLFYWAGQVAPDLVEIEDAGFPFYATITASDLLASLDMEYELTLTPFTINLITLKQAIFNCLSYTGIQDYFGADASYLKTAIHWYPQNAGEWDLAAAHEARVLADGGSLPGTVVQLRTQIQTMQAIELNESFSALVQAMRARVLADGGTFVGSDAQLLAAYPDSVELREGTPGAFGFDPLEKTLFNELSIYEDLSRGAQSDITFTVAEMLTQSVTRMGARIYWADGCYNIDQVANYEQANITTRVYYPSGTLKYTIVNENRNQMSNSSTNRRGGGGLTRFFRPLSSVEIDYKIRLNLNLAQVRDASGFVKVESLPAGSQYALNIKAQLTAQRIEGANQVYSVVWYRVLVLLDDLTGTPAKYLVNGDPASSSNRYNWRPEEAQWSNTAGYFHVYDRALTQAGVPQSITNLSITTPAIPIESTLQVIIEPYALVSPSNIVTTFPTSTIEASVNNEEIYLLDNNAIDNTVIEWSAENANKRLSSYRIDNMLLGDAPLLLAPGSLLCPRTPTLGDQRTVQLAGGWQRNPDAAYEDISRLHAREILAGQQVAVQKIDAWFIQGTDGISLRKRIVRGGKAYIFNGVNLIASLDEWRGTWFEVANVSTGITTNSKPKPPFDPRAVVPAINEPGDDTYLVLNNAQQFGFDLLRTFRITEITADIPAGTTTSISITALGEAYLQAGDQLVIVDTATGQLHQVTLTAAVAAAATTISISSVTLPDIAAGAAIAFTGRRVARMIKKIDSGTLAGLPVSTGGIGDGASPVQINTSTGALTSIGTVKGSVLEAGTEVQIDGTTGAINTSGDVAAAGNVSGDELVAAVAVKAGTKATIDAATGNISADGNMAAGGNVSGDELQASVALKAGTKVTIDASTGNITADGDVSANDVTASGSVNAGTVSTTGDVTVGRDLTVAKKLVLQDLDIGYVADLEAYLESDDAGAYYIKVKLPV